MAEYRYSNSQYLVGICGIAINLFILFLCYYLKEVWFASALVTIGASLSLYGIVETAYYKITVTKEGLVERKLFKPRKICWSEVKRISLHPDSKEGKYIVYLFTLMIELRIPYFIKDSKSLLKHIISQCEDSKDIFIEPKLIEFVKQ